LTILIANETVAPFGCGFTLNIQQGSQVFEQTHLVAVVLGVVLDVPLVSAKIFDDVFLLTELRKVRNSILLTFALKNS
jgi:hypothetical protein